MLFRLQNHSFFDLMEGWNFYYIFNSSIPVCRNRDAMKIIQP